ncbi:m140 protein [Murid betaherpesvirus 1]|uniref:M140 protein n=1 Tax=Murid herpesvirus 1 TaxID=10366 RepID=H2A200_MUHV1|nr:m140 protein [Murid betaherpesvirus 1]
MDSTLWESLPVTDDPAPYRHATRSSFLRVMLAFRDFYRHQSNRGELASLVERRAGERLPLGIPHNWFVELTPASRYEELKGVDINGIVCCDEPLTVVGRIVIRNNDGYEDAGAALCLGAWTRVFVYEIQEDAMILVSPDLDKLARFGLLHCETLYRRPHLPQVTTTPHRLVVGLIMCQDDLDRVSDYCQENSGRDVALYTPGFKYQPMKLLGGVRDAARYWPLDIMNPSNLKACLDEITGRLCCFWHAFAAVGAYAPAGVFSIHHLLVIDTFGAIYTLDMQREKFYRVADGITMLLRAGMAKAIAFGARFDRPARGEGRCEMRVICPHLPDHRKSERSEVDYANEHEWLCRRDRFRPDMRTWDDADKLAINHAVRAMKRKAGEMYTNEEEDWTDTNEWEQEDDDNRGFDGHAMDITGPDDGSRSCTWWPESVLTTRPDRNRDTRTLLRYMSEKKVTFQEVATRRLLERQESHYSLSFPLRLCRP